MALQKSVKVHSLLKQPLHDLQLIQFGGIFTKHFSFWLERFGVTTTPNESTKDPSNTALF